VETEANRVASWSSARQPSTLCDHSAKARASFEVHDTIREAEEV